MNYPSIKKLCQIKDVTVADAKEIRAIMQWPVASKFEETRMDLIDRVLRTHGVEFIQGNGTEGSPDILYCNAGDTYAITVLKVRGRFIVGCWGDIVERGNYA